MFDSTIRPLELLKGKSDAPFFWNKCIIHYYCVKLFQFEYGKESIMKVHRKHQNANEMMKNDIQKKMFLKTNEQQFHRNPSFILNCWQQNKQMKW